MKQASRSLFLRGLSRRNSYPVAVVSIILMLNGMIGWMLYSARQAAWNTSIQSSQNLLAALERDLQRGIEVYDLSLQSVQDGMRLAGIETYDPEIRSLILFDRAISAQNLGPIRVIDPNGYFVMSSSRDADGRLPPPEVVRQQQYFSIQQDQPNVGLFVSGPVYSRLTNSYGIVLSRRIERADGSFGGIVMGTIRLNYLVDLFAGMNLGEGSTIGLINTNGALYLRTPYKQSDTGRDLSRSALFQHFPHARSGIYENIARLDGERRLYSYTQVANYPLILSVAIATKAVYRDWWRQTLVFATAMVLLDFTAVLLLVWLIRELRQRVVAESSLAAANKELAELAVHDPLTGLANRRGFDDMLNREWRRSQREQQPLGLLLLDVDNFKAYNDHYGHGAGDKCLQSVASAIVGSIRRPGDLAARYGGEEFVVVLPRTDSAGAGRLAEAIRQAVMALEIPHEGSSFGYISVSIGAACMTQFDDLDPPLLLDMADRALYRAKQLGRNRIEQAA